MTDGIDRDHFLDYSAKSKIFNLPKHIQLLRCQTHSQEWVSDGRLTPLRRPAIRWSVTSALAGKVTDQGFVARLSPTVVMASGMGPELFDCDRRRR